MHLPKQYDAIHPAFARHPPLVSAQSIWLKLAAGIGACAAAALPPQEVKQRSVTKTSLVLQASWLSLLQGALVGDGTFCPQIFRPGLNVAFPRSVKVMPVTVQGLAGASGSQMSLRPP